MNQEGRDVLVQAALRGHRQVFGKYHDYLATEGECGLGVLHLTLHKNRQEALECRQSDGFLCYRNLCTRYSLSDEDVRSIVYMNNSGLDFHTIARKLEGAHQGGGKS